MNPERSESRPVGAGRLGGRRRRFGGVPPIGLTPVREVQGPVTADAPVWRALLRAAQGVGDALAEPQLADQAPEEARASLDALCEMVRQVAEGSAPAHRELCASARAHRLLGELRRALLAELAGVADRTDTAAVLRVLRAIDDVERIIEQDCTQRFTGRLTAPDGPTMVVEVAHDMRSPLASILFLVETLRNGQSGPLNQVQDRQLGLVYSAAFGLSSLANDVVELARGGDRLLDGEPVPFSLVEIFNGVRDITLPIAVEKGLAVRLLPPEADWRMGCPAALHRVLLNLTTNALKFTSEGAVEVTGRQLSRTGVEFTVTDTGRGIPPEVMEQLFDAFRTRGRRGTHRFSSAGLGLSMCKKLVRGMGGELVAESHDRCGTRIAFTLELPLAPRL